MRGTRRRVYLWREYRRWQGRYWREELPEDLRFEPYTPPGVRGLLSHHAYDPLQTVRQVLTPRPVPEVGATVWLRERCTIVHDRALAPVYYSCDRVTSSAEAWEVYCES